MDGIWLTGKIHVQTLTLIKKAVTGLYCISESILSFSDVLFEPLGLLPKQNDVGFVKGQKKLEDTNSALFFFSFFGVYCISALVEVMVCQFQTTWDLYRARSA